MLHNSCNPHHPLSFGETLTVLVPERCRDGTWNRPAKTYSVGADGTLQKQAFSLKCAFRAEEVAVAGIGSLARLLLRIEQAGEAFVVRGALLGIRHRYVGRRFRDAPGKPATLRDEPKRAITLDVDAVPNLHGIDPRIEPKRAAEFLLSLLPRELEQAGSILRWSSSMCVGLPAGQSPETLSAHIWYFLDEAIGYPALKALLVRVGLHARAALGSVGATSTGKVVDWKLAEPQQPVWTLPPTLQDGLADPFPDRSRQLELLEGRPGTVRLNVLNEQISLFSPVSFRQERKVRKVNAIRPGTHCIPAPAPATRTMLPLREMPNLAVDCPELHAVLNGALMSRQAVWANPRRPYGSGITADQAVGQGRSALEMVRTAMARAVWGRDHPVFAAWTAAGGVPDGERDVWMCSVASLLAQACPILLIRNGALRKAIVAVGRLLCGHTWMKEEWLNGGYDAAIIQRAQDAADGRRVEWRGRMVDPRYAYSTARLLDDHAIGDDECLALGHLSLCADWVEKHNRRRARGHRTLLEIEEANRVLRTNALKLRREGQSLRQSARMLSTSAATLSVLLNTPVKRRTNSAVIVSGLSFAPTQLFRLRPHLEDRKREKEEESAPELALIADTAETVCGTAPDEWQQDVSAVVPPLPEMPEAVVAEQDEPLTPEVIARAELVAEGGIRLPKFLLRSMSDAQRAAERYVAEASELTERLSRRGAAMIWSLPDTPAVKPLSEQLRSAVLGAQSRLHTAAAHARRRHGNRTHRQQAEAERNEFWTGLRTVGVLNPETAVATADERIGRIRASWEKRECSTLERALETETDAARKKVLEVRWGKNAVLTAEQRRRAVLFADIAA